MTRRKNSKAVLGYLLSALMFATGTLWADQGDTHKAVDGLVIYIGVIPAQVIKGRGAGGEKPMHGGIPVIGGRYHLVAALFDQSSGGRITDAHVSAEVTEPGFAVGTHRPLEPMKMGWVITFGNYFAFAKNTVSRVSLSILVPGRKAVKADFKYSPGS